MAKATTSSKINKYVKFAIYLAIVVLLNIALNLTPPGKLDLTANGLFSISRASKQAVKTLNEPLTIKVFFTDNLQAPYNGIKPYIKDILKEYADSANRKYFNYEFIDVGGSGDSNSPKVTENRTLAADYSITPINIQSYEKDEASFKLAYMGIAFIHGDVIESITPIKTTVGLEFRITSTIRKMNNKISALLAMDKNVQIRLYLTSAMYTLFPDSKKIPELVEKVVATVKKQNYNKVDYVHVDTTKEPGKIAEAEALNAYGFTKGSDKYFGDIFISQGDKVEQIHVMELAQSLFGGYVVTIVSEDDLKNQINDAISTLINTNEKIGYLVNNGTKPLATPEQNPYAYPGQQQEQGITYFKSLVEDEYSMVEVNLDDKGIPEGINCLIIGGPKNKFSDYQLYQIDQFLMQGKSLAVFLDGMNIIQPDPSTQMYGYQQPPQFVAMQTGLETMLEHYGVVVEPSYVFDENAFKQGDEQTGLTTLYPVPIVQNEKLNKKIKFVKDVGEVVLYAISPLSVKDDTLKANSTTALKLFSSSDNAWTQKELPDMQSMAYMTPPFDKNELKSFPLAYILEGKFRSYFADKSIPAKPTPTQAPEGTTTAPGQVKLDTKDVKIEEKLVSTGKPGKIFVIGTSGVLENQFFDPQYAQFEPNKFLYMNVIDYLNGREDYAVMRTKLQQYNTLNKTTTGFKNFTKIFNIGVIPVLVVLFGLLIFFQRRAKKVQIQQQFSKSISHNEEVK